MRKRRTHARAKPSGDPDGATLIRIQAIKTAGPVVIAAIFAVSSCISMIVGQRGQVTLSPATATSSPPPALPAPAPQPPGSTAPVPTSTTTTSPTASTTSATTTSEPAAPAGPAAGIPVRVPVVPGLPAVTVPGQVPIPRVPGVTIPGTSRNALSDIAGRIPAPALLDPVIGKSARRSADTLSR